MLSGILPIKLYGWEIPFSDRILTERDKEISFIKKTYLIDIINYFLFTTIPILVIVLTIGIYIFQINPVGFSSEKAFVSITIFNLLSKNLFLINFIF